MSMNPAPAQLSSILWVGRTFRRRGVRVGGVSHSTQHLQVGDQRVHLGKSGSHAIEGADLRLLAITLGHARGKSTVGRGLAVSIRGSICNHGVGVWPPDSPLCL